MDRKSLLSQVEVREPVDEKKLVNLVEEAAILTALRDSKGWKLVYDQFIKPRISVERFFITKNRQQRDETWGAMTDLDALMKFVNGKISEGEKAAQQLESLRKGGK